MSSAITHQSKYKVINIFVLFTIIILLLVYGQLLFNRAGQEAQEYSGNHWPPTSKLNDGTYLGEYYIWNSITAAKVKFQIESGQLVFIEFTNLFGTPFYNAPEKVINNIDLSRDLHFDSVSGATVTSSFAKAAIKNAVKRGALINI